MSENSIEASVTAAYESEELVFDGQRMPSQMNTYGHLGGSEGKGMIKHE